MAFNFDKFESEFKQKRLFQSVAQLFGALRDPADQNARLLGVEPGDPLTQFMEQLRIGTEEPVAEFDFELGEPVTIETAGRLCRDRRVNGAPAPVNLPAMLVTAGQRLFFNTALQQPETYVEIARPEASDLPSEIAVCHFLDGAKTVIDWALSLPKFKALAQERVYTARMAQQALHRLVSRFTPEHSHLVSDMTANEMANYLLRTETNRDKTAYRRKELHELVRKPDMELRAPLTTARRLIDIVYPANRAGTEIQRSTAWRTAIISFLPDEIAIPMSERLKVANEICQPITDAELEAMAYQAEEVYRKPPPFTLKFGRNIGSIPVSAMIQFNSIDNEINQAVTQQEAAYMQQAVLLQQQQQQAIQQAAQTAPNRQNEAELWSMNLQPAQDDRISQLQNQIECLALTVQESMAAVKILAEKGADLDSPQLRAKIPSSEAYMPRNESYQTRNLSRDYTRQDSSGKSYYASRQESSNRNYSAGRQQQDRGRPYSSNRQGRREQSKSPGRQDGNTALAPDRRSRRDEHSAQRDRERSYKARQAYPNMKKGENCSMDYDPLRSKSCSKCTKGGHHEFECFKYEKYSPRKCTVCNKLNHYAGDCKELERLPPRGQELNSMELEKNW